MSKFKNLFNFFRLTDFNFSSHFNGTGNDLLPVPEEVIAIEKMVKKIETESRKPTTSTSTTALTTTTSATPLTTTTSATALTTTAAEDLLNGNDTSVAKSLDKSQNTKSLITLETDHLIGLLPSKSETKLPRSLVVNVDANFSPFRKAEVQKDGLPIPKMKIFLPKNSDTSDDGSSDTSSDEGEHSPMKAS